MTAECRCSPNSGTCCRACRAAVELTVIALRIKDLAPEFSEKIHAVGIELQRALTADRIMRKQEVKVIG